MTDFSLWQTAPLPTIIAHILPRYHETHRQQLEQLLNLGNQVAQAHDNFPENFLPLIAMIQEDLLSHMMKEERVLFPMINQGAGQAATMPIRMMMHEHHEHENSIAQLREVTHHGVLPENADEKWKQLYELVEEFINDLNDHIELENNILFARTLND